MVIENFTTPHMCSYTSLLCDLSLITTSVRECRLFSDIDVLQGSVATRIRCDGVFNKGFIANFQENLSVKIIENRFRFDEVTPVSLVSPFLWDTVYIMRQNVKLMLS